MAKDHTGQRILTLCYEHPPLGGGGGKVARGLINRLCACGFDVDLITMRLPLWVPRQDGTNLTIHQVDARRRDSIVCSPDEMLPYIFRSFWKALRLVRRHRYDVNLSHFLFPDGVVCLALKKLTKLPYVITAHGSDVPGYNPHRFKLLHRLLKPFWRVVARNAETIVCPSQVVQQLVKEECADANTIIIPNAIDPARFIPDRPKQLRILAVCRMVERKGVQYLIEALVSMDRPVQLHVVGDGPYLPTLRKLAAHYSADVVFHGALDNDSLELKELYETSRIFCFVSTTENFPLVLLEGMAAGCAIVTTSGTGCSEVVGNDALLVPVADVDATRAALLELIDDPTFCEVLGQRARSRVEDLFSWDVVTTRYLQVLATAARPLVAPMSKCGADPINGARTPPL